MHKSDKLFGQWVRDNGFDDIPPAARTDARWFATQHVVLTNIPADLTHPVHIRQWHRDHAAPALASEDTSVDQMFSRIAAVSGKERRLSGINQQRVGKKSPPGRSNLFWVRKDKPPAH